MNVRFFFLLALFFTSVILCAQNKATLRNTDTKYLEDQFYAGITYNLLLNRPDGVSQNNFSNSIQLGYIKDIPLNARRNIGLGIGLGYAVNSYYTNLRALETANAIAYEVIPSSVSYKRNKIENHLIEVPLEFRWRTSTSDTYRFWRIYTGIKLGYIFANTSKYIEDEQKDKFSNPDIRRFQYGPYISFGYNTWNFYTHYHWSTVFKDDVTTTNEQVIAMNALKVGLIFYML